MCIRDSLYTYKFIGIVTIITVTFVIKASNDTRAITREDLANSLMTCLTAVPEFGEFCIPLLLEKLDSSARQAKIDSYVLLVSKILLVLS